MGRESDWLHIFPVHCKLTASTLTSWGSGLSLTPINQSSCLPPRRLHTDYRMPINRPRKEYS